jgi:hypothetical protein
MVRLVEEYFLDRNLEAAAKRMAISVGDARQLNAKPGVKALIGAVWRGTLDGITVKDRAICLALCEEAFFHPYTELPGTHEDQLAELDSQPVKAADKQEAAMPDRDEPIKENRFKPGQSGNPSGRPAGSRSKVLVTLLAKARRRASSKQCDKAKAGDAVAGRTILERVWPPRKGARATFDLPEVNSATDLAGAIATVNRQTADGELSAEEASLIVGLLN